MEIRLANRLFCFLAISIMIVFIIVGCTPATSTEAPPQSTPTIEIQPSETETLAPTTTQETAMELVSCSSAVTVSLIQTAVPVTPTATDSGNIAPAASAAAMYP